MLAKAIRYATEMHLGKKRKHMQVQYIEHPLQVMQSVINDAQYGGCDVSAAIAVLQYVVEDCCIGTSDTSRNVLYKEITDQFGHDVQHGVFELTNEYTRKRYPGWNREKRKAAELDRLKKISDRGKVIKLYDRLANLQDTIKCSKSHKNFTELFAKESWDLACGLTSMDNTYIASHVMTLATNLRDMI